MAATDTARTIVAIAGDPGGAAALAPVIGQLQHNGAALQLLGYREAPALWRAEGLVARAIPESANDRWLAEHLKGAALLLAATSANGIDRERQATRLARSMGIPSLVVLDFWSNYRLRFLGADDQLVLPDCIAVMDESAACEMSAAGFPRDRIVVTGQPAFDRLAERKGAFDTSQRLQVRHSLGVGDDEALVLFVSQPFANLYGSLEKAREALGFDEHEVLGLCVEALERLAIIQRNKIVLAIRRHPRETTHVLPTKRGDSFRALACEIDKYDALLAADLVLGMNSVMLLEAVLLGQMVVSFQPGLRLPDALPSNRDGRSVLIKERGDLNGILEEAIFGHTWRRRQASRLETETHQDATGNIVELANHLIGSFCPTLT